MGFGSKGVSRSKKQHRIIPISSLRLNGRVIVGYRWLVIWINFNSSVLHRKKLCNILEKEEGHRRLLGQAIVLNLFPGRGGGGRGGTCLYNFLYI